MTTTVSLDLRGKFDKEIESFIKDLQNFMSGQGQMPTTSTEIIKLRYIKLGEDEMIKTGTARTIAKRVSKHTFDTILEDKVCNH